jgi:hypothetical protein
MAYVFVLTMVEQKPHVWNAIVYEEIIKIYIHSILHITFYILYVGVEIFMAVYLV